MAIGVFGNNGSAVASPANAFPVQLYDSAGNVIFQVPNAATSATAKVLPTGGISESNFLAGRLDRLGNVRPGNDLLVLRDPVEGTTINTNLWTASTGTFTQAQVATTGISFNSASGLASGSYSILTSNKQLALFSQAPLRARFKARVVPQVNALCELGFGAPTTTTAQMTNGAYWRWTSAGTCVPVLSFNGSDVVQGTDVSSLLNSNNYYIYETTVTDQVAIFSIYTGALLVAQQTLTVPTTQGATWGVTHLPVFARLYTAGATTTAAMAFLTNVLVQQFDLLTSKPWSHQLASTGLGGEVNPTTFAQTTNWANSTVATNATLSNTAAGYSTLGGLFSFAAVAGAVTDYALFSLAIPAPYSFIMTGAHVTAYNTGAASATTPTLMHWAAFANSPAVSLASAAPLMRAPIGAHYLPVGAAIGQCADKDLDVTFDAPLRTDSGKFAGILLRMPVATATASQVIQGSVLVKGYFE